MFSIRGAETVSKVFASQGRRGFEAQRPSATDPALRTPPELPPASQRREHRPHRQGPPRRSRRAWPAAPARSPAPVEDPQVQRRAQQRPLRADRFQAPHRPPPEAVVLFELSKARFNDDLTPGIGGGPCRLLQALAQRLDHRGVRPDFNLPAFGVARAGRSHRAVPAVAAEAFDPHAGLGGVAFMIQPPALRAGDGVRRRSVGEVLGGVGILLRGFAFGGGDEHRSLLFGGGLQVGTRAVATVGQSQRVGAGRSGPEVFAGWLDHRRQLANVGFLAGGFAGHNDAFLGIGHGLRIVGESVGAVA